MNRRELKTIALCDEIQKHINAIENIIKINLVDVYIKDNLLYTLTKLELDLSEIKDVDILPF